MTLSDKQKKQVLELFSEGQTNLNVITQTVFKDKKLDGRTKEGRAIRSFLASQGKVYNTTQSSADVDVQLSIAQSEFLLHSEQIIGMNALEIARMVFEDDSIQSLSSAHRKVMDFIKMHRPDVLANNEDVLTESWTNPKSLRSTLRLINKWAHANLGDLPEELSSRHRKCVETLMKFMSSYKLSQHMNSYTLQSDRDLFESEFVRATWEKPDLTIDELNLYMTVCANYVRVKYIQTRMSSLNQLLIEQQNNSSSGGKELTVSLSERIKTTSEELNQTEKRIETLVQKLNGDRSKRLEKAMASNSSFLFLVEEFQHKEGRDRLVRIAEAQNVAVQAEAERLESVDEVKARIFGISRDEL